MNWVSGLLGGGGGRGSGQRLGTANAGYPGAASASASASPRTPSTGGSAGGAGRSPPQQPPQVVEVTFTAEEKQLGMTIVPAGHPQGSCAVVGGVALGGTANRKGVAKGDRVVAVDGNPVHDFDTLEAVLAAIGRPVTFRLERTTAPVAPVAVGAPVGAVRQPPASPQDREREARRAAMAAAAEQRTQAWSRKIEGNRAKDRKDDEGRFRAASDPKTLESVARVKAAEQQEAIYKTHTYGQSQARARIELSQPAPGLPMNTTAGGILGGSGSGSGSGGFPPSPPRGGGAPPAYPASPSSSSSFPAPGVVAPPQSFGGFGGGGMGGEPAPIPPLSREEVEAPEALVAEEEFDAALSFLLDQPAPARQAALATAQQILANLLREPFNEKYRRVKTSTAAFQTRLAGCPGGVEVLTAAGFAYMAEGESEETYLGVVEPPPMVPLRARIVYHRLRQTVAHMQEV